jgi:hypothetical protein
MVPGAESFTVVGVVGASELTWDVRGVVCEGLGPGSRVVAHATGPIAATSTTVRKINDMMYSS